MIVDEVKHFKERLGSNAQRLFVSNVFQITSESITNIFISAFIWRFTGSFYAVAFYQIGFYISLSCGFWINGVLLRKFYLKNIYLVSSLLTGLTGFIVLFFSKSEQTFVFLIVGLVSSFGYGLYWPNRGYLELKEIKDSSRNYYFSLINVAGWTIRSLIPLFAGWLIVLGVSSGMYTVESAYWYLFTFSFLLMVCSGFIIFKGKHTNPETKIITRFNLQKICNKRSLLNSSHGVVDGTMFISSLLVLSYLGNEGVLGTVTAITSLFGSGVLYFYGRFSKEISRFRLVLSSSILFLVCSIGLIFLPDPFGIIIYVLIGPISSSLYYVGVEPIVLAESENEMKDSKKEMYSFIFDNEFFLNLGRVVGVFVFIILFHLFSQHISFKTGPLMVAFLQIAILLTYKYRYNK